MFRIRSIIVVVLTALLAVGLLSAPANAVTKPTVSIKASNYKPYLGKTIKITGAVSGKSTGATVYLQKLKSGKWQTVTKVKLTSSHKYTFKKKTNAKKAIYRAHVSKTKNITAANSKKIVITGRSGDGNFSPYDGHQGPCPDGYSFYADPSGSWSYKGYQGRCISFG